MKFTTFTKKKKQTKFYDVKKILKYNADYNLIFGERSNGKSYAVKQMVIENFFEKNTKGMFLRRYRDDWRRNVAETYFDDMGDVIYKASNGAWSGVTYKKGRWLFTRTNKDGELEICEDYFADCIALSEAMKIKSSQYPRTTIICLEEFIDKRVNYYPGEVSDLINIISTVSRYRGDVRIFLLGNTINPNNPYFDEMNLKNAAKLDAGQIEIYDFPFTDKKGNERFLKILVEHTEPTVGGKESDKYSAFNAEEFAMNTSGEWLTANYPHMTQEYKYLPKHVIRRFYIEFKQDLISCDIVHNDKDLTYIFMSKKTTPLKHEDEDLVFSTNFTIDSRIVNNILTCQYPIAKNILKLYKQNRILYQTNFIGDTFEAYLDWCRTN